MPPPARSRIATAVMLLLVIVGGAFVMRWLGRPEGNGQDRPPTGVAPMPSASASAEVADTGRAAASKTSVSLPDSRFERLADGRSLVVESVEASREIHSPQLQPEVDLDVLDSIFALYRWAYRENPEGGENRELVAALTGQNPHRLVFIAPDHPSLNPAGELLDRWGTPYFFHKISDQVIDVSSAGPDRRLWSQDDLTLGYTESYQATNSPTP